MLTLMPKTLLICALFALLLTGCGNAQHKSSLKPPQGAQPPPPFGSGNDSERAEPLAEKIAFEQVKRRHASERFQMITYATNWTRTEWFAQIDGDLWKPSRPFPSFINRELKVTLDLSPNHSLHLLSYSERPVHVVLHEEP
jgi:hypothetical protein